MVMCLSHHMEGGGKGIEFNVILRYKASLRSA